MSAFCDKLKTQKSRNKETSSTFGVKKSSKKEMFYFIGLHLKLALL